MSAGYRFVYAPALAGFELAREHPFKPLRLELTRSLLEATGLLAADEVVAPEPLPPAALLAVHERRYVAAVEAASRGERPSDLLLYGLGTGDNPVFAGMHEVVLGVCAATVTAVDLVASGRARRAASFAGGLHHAQAAKASGFCLYNDLALGIRHAQQAYGLRVAYLDVDAHHGDGVQWLFYEDPTVLTVSLHESGRYLFPGTGHVYETGRGAGRGTAVNVPLEPYTEDASFLEAFDTVVGPALRAFAPDLIVLQAGADMHRFDPLADLNLTLAGMAACYERVVALADELTGGRLVVTGGGGYDPYRTVPRAWAHAWAALTGRQLPATLPERWRAVWHARLGPEAAALPRTASEDPDDFPPAPHRDAITRRNRHVAQRALATLQELWRETGLIRAD
ncbi:MAG: acetoin utilization protein AcuC [Deinococcales bacterium]|mgnify:CR=1 FL=1|nr:acetoin utilization protein AcuC [Deinococcales bacterium]